MKAKRLLVLGTVFCAWLLVGCDGKDLSTGFPENPEFQCNQCHGNEENAAPPKVPLNGRTGEIDHEALAGVHQAHMKGGSLSAGVSCGDCHIVPEETMDPGHLNGTVEVTFSGLAVAGNSPAQWNAEEQTCSSVYCHGAKLAGGSVTQPEWFPSENSPDALACGACHGSPPPEPHPQSSNCNLCHSTTVDANGAIIPGGTHLNGTKEFSGPHPDGYMSPDQHGVDFKDFGLSGCSECHGQDLKGGTSGKSCGLCHQQIFTSCVFCHGGTDSDSGAPPEDLGGNVQTTALGVGAHTAHLRSDSPWHKTLTCSECHAVPATLLQEGHADGTHHDLTWGALATADGMNPSFAGGTCSSTYCHGGGLGGGTVPNPNWTVVDGSQASCGSCHSLPPPSPHPASNNCQACHIGVVDANMNFVDPSLHMDGKLEVDPEAVHPSDYIYPQNHGADFLSEGASACTECHGADLEGGLAWSCEKCHPGWKSNCTFCHGGVDNNTGAPPVDLSGNVDTTFLTVGAHSAHVATSSNWHATFSCEQCHTKPTDIYSAGHLNGVAALTWGDLASKDNMPSYVAGTCSSVYCHNVEEAGGAHTTPVWNQVDGTQTTCNSCHGFPPTTEDHPAMSDCSMCHGNVVNTDNATFKSPSKHINGDTDF